MVRFRILSGILLLLLSVGILAGANPAMAAGNPALEGGGSLEQGEYIQRTADGFGWESFWFFLTDWFPEGVAHILTFDGADHLLFVLGLALTALSLKQLVLVISFFTLSHGLSLAVAAFTELQLTPALASTIEMAIAFTIFWVAFENIWRRGQVRARALWAFVFGLVHGLGFAKDMLDKFTLLKGPDEGFTGDVIGRFLSAILGFNLGVDFGQILIAGVGFYFITRVFRIEPEKAAGQMEDISSLERRQGFIIGGSFIIAFFGAGMFLERFWGLF